MMFVSEPNLRAHFFTGLHEAGRGGDLCRYTQGAEERRRHRVQALLGHEESSGEAGRHGGQRQEDPPHRGSSWRPPPPLLFPQPEPLQVGVGEEQERQLTSVAAA